MEIKDEEKLREIWNRLADVQRTLTGIQKDIYDMYYVRCKVSNGLRYVLRKMQEGEVNEG